LFGLIIGLNTTPIFAQDDRDEEDTTEVEAQVNPYDRFIGFGPSVATNTIVETLSSLDIDGKRGTRSWEGNPSFGFSIAYNPLEFLMLDGGLMHTRNNAKLKNADDIPGAPTDPDVYTVGHLTARAIANPRGKVSFFASAGLNYLAKRVYATNVEFTDDTQLAFNAGAGFMVNIPTAYGMLIPIAEWRLDFETKNNVTKIPNVDPYRNWGNIEISTFYSLPKLTILWYPKF
ncbi:MAG: hypothetical protein ACKOFB_05485, partial [bacterium]